MKTYKPQFEIARPGPWRDGKCYCFDLRFDTRASGLVMGGEAPLWGEHIDATNLFSPVKSHIYHRSLFFFYNGARRTI